MLRSRSSVPLQLGAGLLACTLALAGPTPTASACGMFGPILIAPERRPSLAREKVLIVHDAARGRQHFIREVAFRRADHRFGFVVPTPTLPEVATVAINPFTRLRERFPFAALGSGVGSGYGSAGAGFGGRGGGEVEVIAVEKVGSFTAFTLAATDAAALAKWLEDNELESTPETEVWLAHYVRMGFYYVAMRYDPPPDAAGRKNRAIAAETVRISFDTPVAYYPYFEPEPTHKSREPRLLEVWYVGAAPVVPVARQTASDGKAQWVRPLKPGRQDRDARKLLASVLRDELEALLPDGELVVQTFQDQKRRRTGFADILFASAKPVTLSPEQQKAVEPLLGVLDPGLIARAP
jgi:hypothetical protein